MLRFSTIVVFAVVVLLVGNGDARAKPDPGEPSRGPTKPVEVVNFPDPQNVAVTNLPDVQDVHITNPPDVQDVNVTGPVTIAGQAERQLVGFSATRVTGDAGVLGFTAACQSEFPDSRMCTSVEVMETVTLPQGLAGEAWVRPVFQSTTTSGGGVDASGIRGSVGIELTCRGWGLASVDGLVVDDQGRFASSVDLASGGCETPRAVACCAASP
ncbi:MAG: hypothetical protein JSU66_12805 [Deltaproteobacteria bacterium]|nr:MAG: hypothetical protein JSU66_12805 [Deltaproteobacteria bacterium]